MTLKSQFWVLLGITNKNHGQPRIQYVVSGESFLMGALYHPGEVPFKKGSWISACWPIWMACSVCFLITNSFVDPVRFCRGGIFFLFAPEKPNMLAGRWCPGKTPQVRRPLSSKQSPNMMNFRFQKLAKHWNNDLPHSVRPNSFDR